MKKWLRVLIPALLIIGWFGLSSVGGTYFGKIDEVSSNDQASFLPSSSESAQVQKIQNDFQTDDSIPAFIIFENGDGLTDSDLAYVAKTQSSLQGIDESIENISPLIPSQDKKAVQLIALINSDSEPKEVVAEIREWLAGNNPENLTSYVSGPAGFLADLSSAFAGIDGLLLGVALIAVFVILLIVYRSPILPFLVLLTAVFALSAALFVIWWLAKWGILQLNGQVQGILFILVIGAATDYSLLYVSRYKEMLSRHTDKLVATKKALKGSIEPIAASAGTVIAGLLCLLLSDLGSNRALGPVASIGILFSVLLATTFLPALLYIFGRNAFWPFKPHLEPAPKNILLSKGIWPAVARFVDKRYRTIWIMTASLLLIAAFGSFGFKAQGVQQSDLILGISEARNGQNILAKHYPGGSGSPTIIITSENNASAIAAKAMSIDGVASVSAKSDTGPRGVSSFSDDKGFADTSLASVDGNALLELTLQATPDSQEAEQLIPILREELKKIDSTVLVGGSSAVAYDSNQNAIRDRNVIIPIVLLVITLILMLLLRSITAPLLLLGTTVLSFAAALGVSAFVFNHLFGFPGADPSVPLYGFIFLVALGIDYNIFLMTRVREEAIEHGTKKGVLRGLVVTGGVITSAGVVLAATFSALAIIPILFLAQIAFIVAFGVLLDTVIVRSLLVPAIIRDIDRKSWWPSKLSK